MSKQNQPAFPTDNVDRVSTYAEPEFSLQGGLTKREYFAIRALQGVISAQLGVTNKGRAILAVEYADALLAELEKKE